MKKGLILSFLTVLFFNGSVLAQSQRLSTPLKILEGEIDLLRKTIDSNYDELKSLKGQLAKLEGNFEKYITVLEEIKKKEKLISQLEGDLKALQMKYEKEEAKQNAEIAALKGKILTPMFDFRFRPEYKNNLSLYNSKIKIKDNLVALEDFFVPSRLRFGVSLKPSELITLVFELQDARFFGEDKLPAEVNPHTTKSPTFHRASLKLDNLFTKGLTLEAGRMSLFYGGGRMIADADWSYRGRVFDGMRLSYAIDNIIKADALALIIKEGMVWEGDDERLFGLYLTSPYLKGFDIDLYFLYLQDDSTEIGEDDNNQKTIKPKIYTIGVRAKGTPVEGLVVEGEAAVQGGKITIGENKEDHFATAYYFSANYTLPVPTKPEIGGIFSSASGDGNPDDTKNYNFYPLYPTRATVWGRMELFNWSNIAHVGPTLSVSPLPWLKFRANYHLFYLVANTGDIYFYNDVYSQEAIKVDKFLGQELDTWVTCTPFDFLEFTVGYSFFLPGKGTEELTKNKDRADFFYTILRARY